jgi:hypothetical protein
VEIMENRTRFDATPKTKFLYLKLSIFGYNYSNISEVDTNCGLTYKTMLK